MFGLRWVNKYVKHLEDEVSYWRDLAEHERVRAEQAINELLQVRMVDTGRAPTLTVVQPSEAASTRKQQEIINELTQNPEFTQAGQLE